MAADFKIEDGFVHVPVEHFIAMEEELEMLEDVRAYDEAMAREEESFPSELVYSILDGANPIKAYRTHRGMTQTQLAEAADVPQSMIAKMENGKREGSVATIKAVAAALRVDVDQII